MSITFVTSFLHGANPKRTYDEYKRHFDSIVETGIPIVLYLDKQSTWTFPTNVRVYRAGLEDTWVGQNIPETSILPVNVSPKDTCEYLKIMNTKTEWLYKASLENPYQTDWFAWIDFGIAHVFKKPRDTLQRLRYLRAPSYPCIRTAGIWPYLPVSPSALQWRFAGGFLMAHKSKTEELHFKVIEKLSALQPIFTWEVNVWGLLEYEGYDLGWFQGSHDDTIIPETNPDISSLSKDPEFCEPRGRQHYRLLAELSLQFYEKTIIDIGTHKGMSALALSYNTTNKVLSFDIVDKPDRPQRNNIYYMIEDVLSGEGQERWKTTILESPLIFLDIDPHEGTREYAFYEWLRDNQYKGLVICDDIWYFKEMRDNFWYKIPSEHKLDITDQGHWSGTGILRFDLPPKPASNWTVVTAYFDLTKMPDASPSIQSRPIEHYLQSAIPTLALDQNLVIFCEAENVDTIMMLRPERLRHKTKCIPMSFEDFPLTKYRDQILEVRKEKPDHDNRNTASYYLFCMARYAMLKQVIQENQFGSTHFAWLNICIERMGWKNLTQLDRVFEINRNKFSTCYIDYHPQTNYLDSVMRNGWCTMCSGFFTGNAYYMNEFCTRIEQKFLDCLSKGYGHADEQLYSLVYFDDPSIFDVYYGDYTEMITNYEWVRDRPHVPLYHLIKHSYEARDYFTCLRGCEKLWNSWKLGYANLDEQQITQLIWYYRNVCAVLRVSVYM